MSLYYPVGFLISVGPALPVFPRLTLRLFFFNTDHGDNLARLVGMLMMALDILV